jgi:hypothetical protein
LFHAIADKGIPCSKLTAIKARIPSHLYPAAGSAFLLLCWLRLLRAHTHRARRNPQARRKPTAAQQPQRVTTTVVVHGEVKDDYLSDAVTVGNLDGATLEGDASVGHGGDPRTAQATRARACSPTW